MTLPQLRHYDVTNLDTGVVLGTFSGFNATQAARSAARAEVGRDVIYTYTKPEGDGVFDVEIWYTDGNRHLRLYVGERAQGT